METSITDSLLPPEMARKAEEIGVSKARIGPIKTSALAVLAGAFIAFGAVFSTVVITGSTMDFGVTRLLAGVAFSLGLILVVVGGAKSAHGKILSILFPITAFVAAGFEHSVANMYFIPMGIL